MRLWLKDDERLPDPEPARADGRKAVVAGTAAWLLALVVVLSLGDAIDPDGWWLLTCIIGCVIGVIGIVVVQVMRRRA